MVVIGGVFFCCCEYCLLGCFVLFWQLLYNSIEDTVGVVTLSQPARREIPPRNEPKPTKHNYSKRVHRNYIKGILRVSCSRVQGDYAIESHRTPTI